MLFEYDALNQLVRRSYPGGEAATFTCTPTGRRATVTDARGTTRWEYDVNDQLVGITHPTGEVVRYAYDPDRNLRRLETPAAVIEYEQDAINRVVAVDAVVNGAPLGESRYGYDAAGNLVEQTRPNGVTTRLAYDVRNRLTSASSRRTASTTSGRGTTIPRSGASAPGIRCPAAPSIRPPSTPTSTRTPTR